MFADLPVAEAAKDPDEYLPQFQKEMTDTRDKLRTLAGIVKELQKIQTATENLQYIAEHGVPRQRETVENSRRTGAEGRTDSGASVSGVGESSPPRREQVLNLLGQVPVRHWKVRDIARVLAIENVKSLRTSLDDFVRAGVIRKNPDNSTYYLGEPAVQTFF